jgi:hypothetical protein
MIGANYILICERCHQRHGEPHLLTCPYSDFEGKTAHPYVLRRVEPLAEGERTCI